MGGNALSVPSRRIVREEYNALEERVIAKLKEKFADVRNIPYYRTKQDFGDMDILVSKNGESNSVIKEYLKTEFGSNEVVCNTDVISFELNGFQVDIILTEPDNMDAAVFYFSYNDLNNLVGRVANQFGLKFGHHGLVYVNRGQSGNTLNKITLTKNPAMMYEFLGYDYERYLQGFDTIEDIFEFVLSSEYFSKEIFSYENLNHQNRTRNRKRKTYQLFLDYIMDIDKIYQFKPEEEYLDYINDFFTDVNLKIKLEEFERAEAYRKLLKEKFSGKVVLGVVPEIKDTEMGNFITYFKNKYSNFDTYLMSLSDEHIKMDIRFHYDIFKSQ